MRGEVNTLGYPKAALLAFGIALLIYNVIAVVQGAFPAQHGEAAAFDKLSGYCLASEIAAAHVNSRRFAKSPRGPKKPPPQRTGGLREKHVSTHHLPRYQKIDTASNNTLKGVGVNSLLCGPPAASAGRLGSPPPRTREPAPG